MKRCGICGESKELGEFYTVRSRRGAPQPYTYCKECTRAKAQAWREAMGPVRMRQYNTQSRERHAEARRRRRADPAYRHAEGLRANHGLAREDFDVMNAAQAGRCAICGEQPETYLHVDHDHRTGRIRGLLCGHCNKALGLFRDDPERLRRALRYLGIIALAEAIGA